MYDIAAEFAAVLFRLWEIKPAGDFPPRKRRSYFDTQKKQDKKKKRERTYFQEMIMKEFLESKSSITLHYRKGSSDKSRTFYPDMDYMNEAGRPGSFEEISAPVVFVGFGISEKRAIAVMELAQAFTKNPVKPKRSILFALWTGEERGILGSRYYVDNPYFPLEKTAAYLNMDMIGWEWEDKELLARFFKRRGYDMPEETLKKIDLSNFLMPSLAEDSKKMYKTIKNCGRYLGITLFLRKSGGMIGGSDYVPFARKNIPWTHFSTGTSKHTHRPSDSIEKINFDMIRDVSRLIYTIAFTLADK